MHRVGVTFRSESRVMPYEDALRIAGLEPVRIQVQDMSECKPDFNGLLLTGGPDVDPARYKCPQHAATKNIDPERDSREIALAERALKRGMPVLGICRGMQLLNVIFGGTLIQELTSSLRHLARSSALDLPGKHRAIHSVSVRPGTRLASIVKVHSLEVNSRHHQAVEKLGTGFTISAVAPDGTIEAIEKTDGPLILGVQWHPEDRILATDHDRAIFKAFAEEVSRAAKIGE